MNYYSTYLWLIFSYLLGSLPSGYIITKLSTKKNVLEIGWRKTSGSNVFKNIGKWQGILTGALDISKGYLAIYGAQKLGFSPLTQVLAGLLAIIGNNWSIFLKFAGGRGLGVFGGALLVFNSTIFWLILIPFSILTIIWNASIGTIVIFILAINLSINFNQFNTTGIFICLSLAPIILKRLSPIGELSLKKKSVILNRLIFDDDISHLKFRIKRIIKKLTKR